jgi:hypothetical protein
MLFIFVIVNDGFERKQICAFFLIVWSYMYDRRRRSLSTEEGFDSINSLSRLIVVSIQTMTSITIAICHGLYFYCHGSEVRICKVLLDSGSIVDHDCLNLLFIIFWFHPI